jgi:hypothetical protein
VKTEHQELASTPGFGDCYWSLSELNALEPDAHHFGSTVENSEAIKNLDEHDRVWRIELVHVNLIDPVQKADDPDDLNGESKIEAIRVTMRAGGYLPHVVVLDDGEHLTHQYSLLEGRHRYNAHLRESKQYIRAFVAHYGCCDLEPAKVTRSG